MKKLSIILFLFFIVANSIAQEIKPKVETNLILGAKYTPFDYIGGIVLGIKITRARFSLNIRNDVSFSVTKIDSSSYFGVDEYRVYNYIDLSYEFYKKTFVFLGLGWVSYEKKIYRFNYQYGYPVISTGLFQKLSPRIQFELRGDIALEKRNPLFDNGFAFPVSFSIAYLLK